MFTKLFPLCCDYTRELVDVAPVCQVGLLRHSFFDAENQSPPHRSDTKRHHTH